MLGLSRYQHLMSGLDLDIFLTFEKIEKVLVS